MLVSPVRLHFRRHNTSDGSYSLLAFRSAENRAKTTHECQQTRPLVRRQLASRGASSAAPSVLRRASIHDLGPCTGSGIDQHIVVSPALPQNERSYRVVACPVRL